MARRDHSKGGEFYGDNNGGDVSVTPSIRRVDFNGVVKTTRPTGRNMNLSRSGSLIPDLPGIIAWFRSDLGTSFAFDGDVYVTRWEDQSGNGNHLTQSINDFSIVPTWTEGSVSTLGGYPHINFSEPPSFENRHMFFVQKIPQPLDGRIYVVGSTTWAGDSNVFIPPISSSLGEGIYINNMSTDEPRAVILITGLNSTGDSAQTIVESTSDIHVTGTCLVTYRWRIEPATTNQDLSSAGIRVQVSGSVFSNANFSPSFAVDDSGVKSLAYWEVIGDSIHFSSAAGAWQYTIYEMIIVGNDIDSIRDSKVVEYLRTRYRLGT